MEQRALVTNIQRYSLNDGPGIRTTVFLKGCSLRCPWCHNPECISSEPEIYYKQSLCRQCGVCFDVCPLGAVQPPIEPIDPEKEPEKAFYYKIDLTGCDHCMKCVEACPYEALTRVGDEMTVEEILDEVERDWPFYNTSGGGMTLTGGEPALFPDFTLDLLKGAKDRGLHVCLDTSGYCDWEVLSAMAEYVDIFLYDLKNIDDGAHRKETGVGNELILANLRKLVEGGCGVYVRIPVIPGYNDSEDHMERLAQFLAGLSPGVEQVDLLPFHNWCQDKYRWLGLEWDFGNGEGLHDYEVEEFQDLLEERGLNTTIGG